MNLDRLDSAGRLGAPVHWWRHDAEQIFLETLLAEGGKIPNEDDLRVFARLYVAALELVSEREEHAVLGLLYRWRGHPALIVPSKTVDERASLSSGWPMASLNASTSDGKAPAHVIHMTIVSPRKSSIQSFAETELALAGLPAFSPRVASLKFRDALWGGREAFCVGWRLKLARRR
jgi:hypothetical protein